MKKYDYYINNKVVPRQEMMRQLKNHCLKVTDTIEVGGGLTADFAEYDEKAFKKWLYYINKGSIVLFDNISFHRKESK